MRECLKLPFNIVRQVSNLKLQNVPICNNFIKYNYKPNNVETRKQQKKVKDFISFLV